MICVGAFSFSTATGIFDTSTAYPILARNLRTRRDNLLATITMLDSRLVEADMAA